MATVMVDGNHNGNSNSDGQLQRQQQWPTAMVTAMADNNGNGNDNGDGDGNINTLQGMPVQLLCLSLRHNFAYCEFFQQNSAFCKKNIKRPPSGHVQNDLTCPDGHQFII
jgi:hypothetical protein